MNMERIKPTRSGLFAIELLIAVGVFSLCAAICVGLFVRSEVMSRDSADLSRAVAEARSAAECFKAAGGDMERTAELIGGRLEDENTVFLRFDQDWNRLPADSEDWDVFLLCLVRRQKDPRFATAILNVAWCDSREDVADDFILEWEIAALEVAS